MRRLQSTNFVVLTGHLNDYPLQDLIGILRRQRKTGRLLIEYAVGPCAFYFAEGKLVDAQLNSLGGLQAVIVALSQPDASFNFNPLIAPPRRSINDSSQKVIMELLGCWEEKTIGIEPSLAANEQALTALPSAANLGLADSDEAILLPAAKERLALPPATTTTTIAARGPRTQQVVVVSAIISVVVSLLTVIALTSWYGKGAGSVSPTESARTTSTIGSQSGLVEANKQTVQVTLRIEGGRVTRAFVAEHRQGMEAYEALALKVARARRYGAGTSGEETVLVKIDSPR